MRNASNIARGSGGVSSTFVQDCLRVKSLMAEIRTIIARFWPEFPRGGQCLRGPHGTTTVIGGTSTSPKSW